MIRVGIISANWGMEAHLPAWRAIDGVEVVAVCTSRRETAEAAAQRHGLAKAYWSHAEMAADPDLDVIDIGTRPDLRRDMTLEAIHRGKHVFAAANFAANIEAAREMRDAARAAGIVAALDSTLAQAPAHRLAARMLEEGYLGEPVSATVQFGIPLFNPPNARSRHWRWFGQKKHGASTMRNLGTHALHMLVELLGPVETVVAQSRIAVNPWRMPDGEEITSEVDDSAQLMLRFACGAFVTVNLSWVTPALAGWRMEMTGDRGFMRSTFAGPFPAGPEVRLHAAQNGAVPAEVAIPDAMRQPRGVTFAEPPLHVQSYDIAGVMADFIEAIRGNGAVQPDFERAFHVEVVLEAARISISEKRWVGIGEIPA